LEKVIGQANYETAVREEVRANNGEKVRFQRNAMITSLMGALSDGEDGHRDRDD